jgi:hypothetical protein
MANFVGFFEFMTCLCHGDKNCDRVKGDPLGGSGLLRIFKIHDMFMSWGQKFYEVSERGAGCQKRERNLQKHDIIISWGQKSSNLPFLQLYFISPV